VESPPLEVTGSREVVGLPGRDAIIRRIRMALGRPLDHTIARSSALLPPSKLAGVLPPIPPEEVLSKFEAELTRVAGVAHRAANRQALEEILKVLLSQTSASRVVLSRNPLLAELKIEALLRAWGTTVSVWPAPTAGEVSEGKSMQRTFADASFAASLGITGVEYALAETGSLVVTSWTEGAQLASLAPPVHVALYRRRQLVATLDEVLERLRVAYQPGKAAWGRSVVFITGTSRTADIEQILIRGVHGPGELHAVLVEEGCFA
jgi:L-lactate dehydrogenase complex protein LldG